MSVSTRSCFIRSCIRWISSSGVAPTGSINFSSKERLEIPEALSTSFTLMDLSESSRMYRTCLGNRLIVNREDIGRLARHHVTRLQKVISGFNFRARHHFIDLLDRSREVEMTLGLNGPRETNCYRISHNRGGCGDSRNEGQTLPGQATLSQSR